MFEQLLKEAGCQVETSEVLFEVDSVLFRRSLSNKLRSHGLEEFNQDLQTYTEDPIVFRKCLLPSTMAVPTRASSSESLFKILLAIDSIQPELIIYLLERLPEFYDELETDNSSSCTARLILHQLRWLDYIAQPEILTEKLIEIIQITPAVIQHELITSLPDIVNDSEHKPIVVFLKDLMNENPELTVPILDALSNLTLHSESLEDVRQLVLERLESAKVDDLAVIVKFLLQTVTQNTIDFVVYGIRQKLDFRSLGKQVPEALIIESIKLGLQFHKFVCDSWLKSIVALEEQREHKVIDFLVLIILYSMTSMKKKVEGIIKKKIIQGHITTTLIQETIMCHADGLAGYWNVLLSLSESLLRSCQQTNAISPCASTLYISSFKSCDVYYRQEIIGALVTHIGSGVEAEMNVSLNVLLQLVKFDVSSVAVFSVFVKGILDYLDNLNLYQIRTLFDIFSLLALTTGNATADGSANLWSEIQIVIRKQLSNPREKYKNIGIIGCLSSVKVLGSRALCNDQSGSSSVPIKSLANNALRHPVLRQATSLLELALRFSQENPNCIALIYDELAHLISEEDIDERLQIWVKDNMTSDFTEYYVVSETDADIYMENVKDNEYIKLEPEKMMNLDEDESEIIIKMYEMFYSPDIKTKKKVVVPMASIFNLIQSCEKKLNNGSLQDVDALFGCGILLFKMDDLDDISPAEVEYACDMLFYTINWFREILNSFMFSEEDGFRERLVKRLRNMIQLEGTLNRFMRQIPSYAPLEFHTTVPVNITNVKNSSQMISSAVSAGSQDSQQTVGTKSIIKDIKMGTMKFKNIGELKPYMRAFSVHLLELLKYNQDIKKENDQLTCEEINYILKDLNNKLDIKIMPPPPVFFGKKKSEDKHPTSNATMLARMDAQNLMKKVVSYLPYILQTLENLYNELQERDIEAGRIEGSEDIANSISLVFNIIFKLLSWPDIQNSDNHDILQDMISIIASRIGSEEKNSAEELEQAFTYLSQYIDSVPQAKTGLLLFNILQRLLVMFEKSTSLKRIALKVVNQIITTNWFDWRDIKKEIPFLIEQFIELNDDRVDILHELVNNTLPQFEEQGSLEIFPLLKEETIVQHYQAVINQTVKAFDLFENTDQDVEIVLVFNSRIIKIFERITHYVKAKEDRVLIGILLKTGRLFIDQFTKHSIPFFTGIFKSHSSSIVGIFKTFQASTRMLQIICSHVKVLKEVTLSAYVPPLKKALEIVIYQVKMLLTENRIPQSAFFTGALKHRDIRGMEVSSQIPRQPDSDEESEAGPVDSEPEEEQQEEQEEEVAQFDSEDELPTLEEENEPKKKMSIRKPTAKRTVNKKRKAPLSNAYSGLQVRTSSIVPSSDEDEELEDEAITIVHKRLIEPDQSSEEEEEDLIPSTPPIKEKSAKRRRLGLGRPVKSSQKKIFNLTGKQEAEDSE